jgi:hypothetical protein
MARGNTMKLTADDVETLVADDVETLVIPASALARRAGA